MFTTIHKKNIEILLNKIEEAYYITINSKDALIPKELENKGDVIRCKKLQTLRGCKNKSSSKS